MKRLVLVNEIKLKKCKRDQIISFNFLSLINLQIINKLIKPILINTHFYQTIKIFNKCV